MGTHLALLRGINVGGKNKIEMARLRDTFSALGLESVTTYINTGNVVFNAVGRSSAELAEEAEEAMERDFTLSLKVLVRDLPQMQLVSDALPDHWVSDATMKSEVMFLWDEIDSPDILEGLSFKPDIEEVIYVPGAILWSVDRSNATRSGMMKLAGTRLYKQMTVRNCNTTRKLVALMEKVAVS